MHEVAMSVVRNGVAERLAYQWEPCDSGRATSRRPKQRNDCTVRALATARGIGYDEAYDLLASAGRKCGRSFVFSEWIGCQAWASKISFPAAKGHRRMNPASFVRQFASGVYICKVAKHVFAVVDGVVFDVFENAPDRCIYTAWRVERAAP